MNEYKERKVRQLFALLRKAKISTREDRLALMGAILHLPVGSTTDLSEIQIQGIVDVLVHWDRQGELLTQTTAAITGAQASNHD